MSKNGKGLKVIDSLQAKHPEARIAHHSMLQSDKDLPEFLDLNITDKNVSFVGSKMSGAAGLSGFDTYNLRLALLRFGRESTELRKAVAIFVNWLSNEFPPWAAYRALMSCCLVALDKMPGVCPLGIGETWRRLFAKVVVYISGNGVQKACGSEQLCNNFLERTL